MLTTFVSLTATWGVPPRPPQITAVSSDLFILAGIDVTALTLGTTLLGVLSTRQSVAGKPATRLEDLTAFRYSLPAGGVALGIAVVLLMESRLYVQGANSTPKVDLTKFMLLAAGDLICFSGLIALSLFSELTTVVTR